MSASPDAAGQAARAPKNLSRRLSYSPPVADLTSSMEFSPRPVESPPPHNSHHRTGAIYTALPVAQTPVASSRPAALPSPPPSTPDHSSDDEGAGAAGNPPVNLNPFEQRGASPSSLTGTHREGFRSPTPGGPQPPTNPNAKPNTASSRYCAIALTIAWQAYCIANGFLGGWAYLYQAGFGARGLSNETWKDNVVTYSVALNALTYYLISDSHKEAIPAYYRFWEKRISPLKTFVKKAAMTFCAVVSTGLFLGALVLAASPLYTATYQSLVYKNRTDLEWLAFSIWIQRTSGLFVAWTKLPQMIEKLQNQWNGKVQLKVPTIDETGQTAYSDEFVEIAQANSWSLVGMRVQAFFAVLPTLLYTIISSSDLSQALNDKAFGKGVSNWMGNTLKKDNLFQLIRYLEIAVVVSMIGPFNLFWVGAGMINFALLASDLYNAYQNTGSRRYLYLASAGLRVTSLYFAYGSGAPAASQVPVDHSHDNTQPNLFTNSTGNPANSTIPTTAFDFELKPWVGKFQWMTGSFFNYAAVCLLKPCSQFFSLVILSAIAAGSRIRSHSSESQDSAERGLLTEEQRREAGNTQTPTQSKPAMTWYCCCRSYMEDLRTSVATAFNPA